MSVLNQMLRDLEKRGAAATPTGALLLTGAAAATLGRAPRAAHPMRRFVYSGLAIVVAATAAAYVAAAYSSAQVTAPTPLGARQYPALLHPLAASQPPGESAAAPAALPQHGQHAHEPAPMTAAAQPATQSPAAPIAAAAERPQLDERGSEIADLKLPGLDTDKPIPEPLKPAQPPSVRKPTAAPLPAAGSVAPTASLPTTAPRNESRASPAAADVAAPSGGPGAMPPVIRRAGANDAQQAAELISRGRHADAAALLQQLLARQPTHDDARAALAALLAEHGQRRDALRTLLEGVASNPQRFAVPAARLQVEHGDAVAALGTLQHLPPAQRSPDIEALAASIAQRSGAHALAIDGFTRALRKPQAPALWWVGLAVSLDAVGDRSAARSAFARASRAELPPEVAAYVAARQQALDAVAGQIGSADVADVARTH